jgi:hypothetical protein
LKLVHAALPLLLLTMTGTAALARERHDTQLWVNITGQGSIAGDLVYFAELQPRIGGDVSRLDQLMLRSAIGLKLSDSFTLYQGYARVRTPVEGNHNDTIENRSFQQINWKMGTLAGGPLSSRTRIEQRWLSTGTDMGWRVREMLRLALPLDRQKPGIAALGYVEGFFALNDTDWGARSGFDRVRTFAGAEIPVGGKSTMEIGYLNQTVNRASGNIMDHVASISLFLRQ